MEQPPSHQQHREAAAASPAGHVRCGVITVSDTRSPDSDTSGRILLDRLAEAGHVVVAYDIVPDEPERIRPLLTLWCEREDIEAVLVNGGTGIARRDRTFDVVDALLDKRLPGFGEIFRMLSFQEVGAAAMLSRAVAGVRDGTLLFSMPGSPNAVTLAVTRLILPELAHLVWELRR